MARKSAKPSTAKDSLHITPKKLKPLTRNQTKAVEAYHDEKHLILAGIAGTGKTYIAMSLGIESIFEGGEIRKMVIVRSAVPTRDVGHLPGSLAEKNAIYELPYRKTCNDICGRGDAYEILKQKDLIEFCNTSYLRGLTLDNCVVFIDEVQNLTIEEISTVVTRMGKSSRLIISGDIQQSDLSIGNKRKEISGFTDLIEIASYMKEMVVVWFTAADIVRSGLVKSWILARERHANRNSLENILPKAPPKKDPPSSNR